MGRLLTALLVLAFLARVGVAQAPPADPKTAPARDYYFISDDLIRNKDGTLTWFYVTNHVGASALSASLQALRIKGLKTTLRKREDFQFRWDKSQRRMDISAPTTSSQVTDENVLMLTFPPAYKDIVEEFLQRFDVPTPQVHLKAKVVEVTLDSNLEYGVSWFFDQGGGNPSLPFPGSTGDANTDPFLRTIRSSFRPTSFQQPFLSPGNTGLAMLFDDFGTETLIAQIEALQERGTANILSEPSIVATQGKLASIITGQEIPISELRITGQTDSVTTVFKETGIRLDFTPLHIGREFVKLRVRVEVSSVTDFVIAQGSDFTVQNPIISQRNAESVVSVRDGMTLVIGGLYAISEIDDKAGVPILGDIPVLGVLFSRTKKTKVKSELDFFITPNILRNRLSQSVFVPPRERRRLRELEEKEKKDGAKEDKPPSPEDESDLEKD